MENKKYRLMIIIAILTILEFSIFVVVSSFFSSPVSSSGNTTVTVPANLTVGLVYPEIPLVNITDNSGANITLTADSNKTVYCNGIAKDLNNRSDISSVTAEFFYKTTSFYGDVDDNNTHYTNNSCYLNLDVTNPAYGDDASGNYTANYSCSFSVQYYANSGSWNCTVYVNDIYSNNGSNSSSSSISQLLAISLPSSINYGTVNATNVSLENVTNVTNVGNVQINLSLSGYAVSASDNLAMNCTKGSLKNISVMYEKYNLTATTVTVTGLSDFENHYLNLSNTPAVKRFVLNYRQNDTVNEATNQTFWRIYVPKGVAGTCEGKIVFAASVAAGS